LKWEDAGTGVIPTLAEVLTAGPTGDTGQSITLQDDTSTIEIFGSKIGLDNSYGSPGQVLTSGGSTGPLKWEDSVTDSVPIGTILPFAGLTLPDKYLWCDGASLVKADYPNLFSVIGSVYGGNATDSFNVPNLTSRFPVGSTSNSSMGVLYNSVTSTMGGNSTISTNQIPDHMHSITFPAPSIYVGSLTGTNIQNGDDKAAKDTTENNHDFPGYTNYDIYKYNANGPTIQTQTEFLPPFTSIQYIIKYI
jgi:microcystin-dependent protein